MDEENTFPLQVATLSDQFSKMLVTSHFGTVQFYLRGEQSLESGQVVGLRLGLPPELHEQLHLVPLPAPAPPPLSLCSPSPAINVQDVI